MSRVKKTETDSSLDRRLFFTARAILGLALFPIVTLLAAMGLAQVLVVLGLNERHEVGGLVFVSISGAIVGLATSALVVWKSSVVFSPVLAFIRSNLREPIASCIEFGIVGALILGGFWLGVILLLGHVRPIGWDFNRIPLLMGSGFAIFSLIGLRIGLVRKRRRNI